MISNINNINTKNLFETLIQRYKTNNKTELQYYNHYQLLVAIMLSAQSTDKQVNKITDKLFKKLKTPKDALKLGFDEINKLIKSVNYHNMKAKHIVEMSQKLIDEFGGEVPNNMNDLTSLAGVGRKTANLVLNIAFGKSTIAVDTHVFRVAERIGLTTKKKNPFDSEKQLSKNVPQKYHEFINETLILLGREFCTARKCKCKNCPVKEWCRYRRATSRA